MESPLICRILNLLRLHQLESPQHGQRISARDLSRPRELRGLLGITWALSTLFQPPLSAFVKIASSVENKVHQELRSTPNGIRTRAATLKGWCPRPLDDGGLYCCTAHAVWSGCRDLNPGPLRPERSALPSCATARSELPRSPIILVAILSRDQRPRRIRAHQLECGGDVRSRSG